MNIIEPELHENCLRCGRKLRSEESKILGYGPICWEKHTAEMFTVPLFDMFRDSGICSNADNIPDD